MLDHNKIKTEWDLSPVLNDTSNESIDRLLVSAGEKVAEFVNKWKNDGSYLSQPVELKKALDEFEQFEALGGVGGDLSYYFGLASELNLEDPEIKAKTSIITEELNKLGTQLDFFTLSISKIPEAAQALFLDSPELKDYKHYLEMLFKSGKHTLSEKEERVFTLLSPTAYTNWVRMTSEFISSEKAMVLNEQGEQVLSTFTDMSNLISSSKREVRESSAAGIDGIFSKYAKVAEAELNSVLSVHKTSNYLRSFDTPDQSRHLQDDVDKETVDTIIEVVTSNYDLVHKYYQLKARLLSQPKIRYFERNAYLAGLDKKFTFEETADLVYKSFSQLSPEFAEILEEYLYKGQIDVLTKKGKTSMQFCAGGGKFQPVYILLNYGEKLQDASTLAHELGHAINDELVKKSQNALNASIPLCLAETASTFFEDFVTDTLADTLDQDTRVALQISRLDDSVNTVFRQIACYLFERDLHESISKKGFLSYSEIGELFTRRMSEYCGPIVEMTPNSNLWWIHWSHIRSFFYVYTYAFGFLVSKSFQGEVKKDKRYIEKVKQFLSMGSSQSPKIILSDLGIDINSREFWQKGVDQIRDLYEETQRLV